MTVEKEKNARVKKVPVKIFFGPLLWRVLIFLSLIEAIVYGDPSWIDLALNYLFQLDDMDHLMKWEMLLHLQHGTNNFKILSTENVYPLMHRKE